jgi:hypothetical protein
VRATVDVINLGGAVVETVVRGEHVNDLFTLLRYTARQRSWVPRSQCLGPCGNVPRRGRTARAREILSELAELIVACPEWPPVDRRALSVLPLDTTSFPPRDHEAR